MTAAGPSFSVSVAPDGAFVLTGELDLATIPELRDSVDAVLAPGRAIVLDLTLLTFMESSVIHWLVEISDATGHPVALRNARPVLRQALDIVGTVGTVRDAWVFEDAGESTS
jgi:anti-anti-sigma factor